MLCLLALGDFSNVATADVYGQVSDGAVIECPSITYKPGLLYSDGSWAGQHEPVTDGLP